MYWTSTCETVAPFLSIRLVGSSADAQELGGGLVVEGLVGAYMLVNPFPFQQRMAGTVASAWGSYVWVR